MAKIANNKEHFLPFTDTQGIIIESTRPQKNRIPQSDMEYSTIQTKKELYKQKLGDV